MGNQRVQIALPDPLTSSYEKVFLQTIFTHFRHELVLQTTLPLNNIIEVHNKESTYLKQLASYRFPSAEREYQYNSIYFRTLKEERTNVIVFEKLSKTHNAYKLTGTDLQNFHIRLREVNYAYNAVNGVYEKTEGDYPLHKDTIWYVQFTLQLLA